MSKVSEFLKDLIIFIVVGILLGIPTLLLPCIFMDQYEYVRSLDNIYSVTKYDDGYWAQLKLNGHIVEYPIQKETCIVPYCDAPGTHSYGGTMKILVSDNYSEKELYWTSRPDKDGAREFIKYPLKDVIVKDGKHEDIEYYSLKEPIEKYPEAFMINYNSKPRKFISSIFG